MENWMINPNNNTSGLFNPTNFAKLPSLFEGLDVGGATAPRTNLFGAWNSWQPQRPAQTTANAPYTNPFTGMPTKYNDIGSQLFVALHGRNPIINQTPQQPQVPSYNPAMANIIRRNADVGIAFPSWFGQGA